jgi:hypothetical protein
LERRIDRVVSGARSTSGGQLVGGTFIASAADTVDGFHASATLVAGKLLALDSSGKYPASAITLDSPSGLQLTSGLALADSVAGNGLTISAKVLAVNLAASSGLAISADALQVDKTAGFTWTGAHAFQSALTTTRHLLPEATDSYDLGSPTVWWRKGYLSELDAVIFAANSVAITGGWQVIGHGAGTLAAPVSASDGTIDFGMAMSPKDFVLMRAAGQVEYLGVGDVVADTSYKVMRNLDGTGANNWVAGTPYLIEGTLGDGRIEMSAGLSAPKIQILSQGATYNAQTEYVRLGDLNGGYGVGAPEYGMGVGDYAAGNYMLYGPTQNFQIHAGGGSLVIDADGISVAVQETDVSLLQWTETGFGDPLAFISGSKAIIGENRYRLSQLVRSLDTGYGAEMQFSVRGDGATDIDVGLALESLDAGNYASLWGMGFAGLRIGTDRASPASMLEVDGTLAVQDVTRIFELGTGAAASSHLTRNAYQDGAAQWRRTVADNDAGVIQLNADGFLAYYTQTDADATAGGTITLGTMFRVNDDGTGYVGGNSWGIRTAKTPASAGATGAAGDLCWDSGYLYVCVAANSWKRATIAW